MPNLNQAIKQAMQQPPAMTIAQPLNDIQLVALIAAHSTAETTGEAAQWAFDLVTDCIVLMQGDALQKAVMARLQPHQSNGIVAGH